MKTGTKSLLFGGHQVIIHPIFVLVAWIKLHGWKTLNWSIVVAIIIHDWGYWGCEKMDDEKGEAHPLWASEFLSHWWPKDRLIVYDGKYSGIEQKMSLPWFVKYHSRFLARKDGVSISPLCLADKYGVGLMPTWLYVLLCRLSGEIWEYMSDDKYEINLGIPIRSRNSMNEFFEDYKKICIKWVSGEVPLEPWHDN